ncbi:MAG: hypothetical protein JNK75_09615 [Betaproteobacteria bacterium]|nr:hypothetical protein [Betaproteobacteria bacterium]
MLDMTAACRKSWPVPDCSRTQIERKLGARREAGPRGRPRKAIDEGVLVLPGQEKLP